MESTTKIKGNVESVTINDGKAMAKVSLLVPKAMVLQIPLGAVSVSIQTLQSALFNKGDTMKLNDKKSGRTK